MVDGDSYFRIPHTPVTCHYLSTPPIQPYPQLIIQTHPSAVHQYLSMLTPSYLPQFFGSCCCPWEPFFYHAGILYLSITPSTFTHSICLSFSNQVSLASLDFLRITRGLCVFGCVLNTLGWRPFNPQLDSTMYSQSLRVSTPCMYVIRD